MNILITGDFCPQLRLESLISQRRFAEIYNDFAQVLQGNDLNITNLECPLVDAGSPIPKVGRHLKGTPRAVEALRYGGFNLLTLANNHIMDFGAPGLVSTLELCGRDGIAFVGAGETLAEAERIFYHEKDGLTLGVLSVAENEFSIATHRRAGANPLSPVRNFKSTREAAERADHVLVVVHGGHEGYSYPSERMRDTFRFFIDAGATIVVAHHAHCYSGFESYEHGYIFYGLGNFLFDRELRNAKWNYGYAVRFTLGRGRNLSYSLIPYVQGNDLPGVQRLKGDDVASFEANLHEINAVIQDPEALWHRWREHVRNRSFWLFRYLLPLTIGLNDMYLRLGLPIPYSRRRMLRLLNMIRCESHNEVLIDVLKTHLE